MLIAPTRTDTISPLILNQDLEMKAFPSEVLTMIFLQALCNSQSLKLTCSTFLRVFDGNSVLKSCSLFHKKLKVCYMDAKSLHDDSFFLTTLKCIKALALIDQPSALRLALNMEICVEKVRALSWLLSNDSGLTAEKKQSLTAIGFQVCQHLDDTIRSLQAKTSFIFAIHYLCPQAACMLKDQVFYALNGKKRTAGHLMATIPLCGELGRVFPEDAGKLARSLLADAQALKNNQNRSKLLAIISTTMAHNVPTLSSVQLKETIEDTKRCQPGAKIAGFVDIAIAIAPLYPDAAADCLKNSLDLIEEKKKLITDLLVIDIAKTAVFLGGVEGKALLGRVVASTQKLLTDFQKARALVHLSELVESEQVDELLIEAEGLSASMHRHWRSRYDALMAKTLMMKDPKKGELFAEKAILGATGLPEREQLRTLTETAEALSYDNTPRSMEVLDMIGSNSQKMEAILLIIKFFRKRIKIIDLNIAPGPSNKTQ